MDQMPMSFFFICETKNFYSEEDKNSTTWDTILSIKLGVSSIHDWKLEISVAYWARAWATLFPERGTWLNWIERNQ